MDFARAEYTHFAMLGTPVFNCQRKCDLPQTTSNRNLKAHRFHIRISQATYSRASRFPSTSSLFLAEYIHNDQKLDSGGCQPTICRKSFINRMQQPKVLINGCLLAPDVKDVKARVQ